MARGVISNTSLKKILSLLKSEFIRSEKKVINNRTYDLITSNIIATGIHINTFSSTGLGYIYSEDNHKGDIFFRVTISDNSTTYYYTSIRTIYNQLAELYTKISNIEKKIN